MNDLAISDHQNVLSLPVQTSCRFLSTGLILAEDTTIDEWERVGRFLKHAEESVQWWIGDWLRFGEKKYGKTYKEIAASTGYAVKTLQNFAFVAEKVESSRRREDLEWSFHAEVAGLKPSEQDRLLKKAKVEDWKHKDLRAAVAVKQKQTKAVESSQFFDSKLEFAKLAWKNLKDSVQFFAREYPRFSLYVEDFVLSVEEEFADASGNPSEYLMVKHERGARSWDALVKATGFTPETVERLVGELVEQKKLKIVPRGGKTDSARGAVEDVIAAWDDPVGLDFRYEDRDDEDDE